MHLPLLTLENALIKISYFLFGTNLPTLTIRSSFLEKGQNLSKLIGGYITFGSREYMLFNASELNDEFVKIILFLAFLRNLDCMKL